MGDNFERNRRFLGVAVFITGACAVAACVVAVLVAAATIIKILGG